MAVAGGYVGTKEEFEADMGNSGTNATNAANSAAAAAASAAEASAIADDIAQYKTDTMTAPANITAGEYVLAAGTLYRATANIASGSTLTPNGNVVAVTVGEELTKVIASDAQKADADGTSPNLTAGNALQLVSTVGIEDQVPYNFRTSGGTADIGDREEDMVVGGTIVWNQQIQNGNFADTSVWSKNRCALSVENNVGTFTCNAATYAVFSAYQSLNVSADHVYIMTGELQCITINPATFLSFVATGAFGNGRVENPSNEVWYSLSMMTRATGGYASLSFQISLNYSDSSNVTVGDKILARNVNVFDLTQMFGSTIADYIYSLEQTNAGDGVAWFKKLFPKEYYAYDAGSLQSVQTSAHKMVGFNANPQSFNRGYDWLSGTYQAAGNNHAAQPQKIRVVPGATYCFSATKATAACYFCVYEFAAYGTYIHKGVTAQALNANNGYHKTFTVHSDTCYVGLTLYRSGSDFALSECEGINWNLSWDGEKDGTYEPYVEYNYPLDSSLELRGIPKLDENNKLRFDGDTYESNGTVTRRYAFHELSDLAWSTSTVSGVVYFIAKPDASTTKTGDAVSFGWCSVYSVIQNGSEAVGNLPGDGVISFRCGYFGSGNLIAVRDDSISTVLDLRTKITSKGQIVTRLLTPTTETAEPYTNPQIVNDFGTEEYVDAGVEAGTRDVAIPVGHETFYQQNLKSKLEMAPDSPSGDGTWVVKQENGENVYVPLIIPAELPQIPGTDGVYTLKATVTDGTAVLSWETMS